MYPTLRERSQARLRDTAPVGSAHDSLEQDAVPRTRLLTSNLSTDILDRIDQIVAPGSTIADDGNTYLTDALTNPFLRRRRTP